MRLRIALVFIGVLGVSSADGQQSEPMVTSLTAKEHVGKTATVCGEVTDYGCRDIDYVSFAVAPVPQRAGDKRLEFRLLGKNRSTYTPKLEERFLFQVVCTQGKIEEDRNGYFVSVPSSDSLQVQPQTPPVSLLALAPDAYSGCDPHIVLPKVTRQVDPVYPRSESGSAAVMLRTVVETDGRAGNIQVLVSASPEFDQAAGRMLREWRFTPGTLLGEPVPVIITVEARFGFR